MYIGRQDALPNWSGGPTCGTIGEQRIGLESEATEQFAVAVEDAVKRHRLHPLKTSVRNAAVRLCFSLNSEASS